MPRLEDDVRSTAQDIAADAAELQETEEQKIRLRPEDPRMGGLARKSERIARRLVPKTAAQRELADEVADPPPRRRSRPH